MRKYLLIFVFVLSTSSQSTVFDTAWDWAKHNPALAIGAGIAATFVLEPLVISAAGMTIAPLMYMMTPAIETAATALATAGEVIPLLATGVEVITVGAPVVAAPTYAPVVFTAVMGATTLVSIAGATGALDGVIEWGKGY